MIKGFAWCKDQDSKSWKFNSLKENDSKALENDPFQMLKPPPEPCISDWNSDYSTSPKSGK